MASLGDPSLPSADVLSSNFLKEEKRNSKKHFDSYCMCMLLIIFPFFFRTWRQEKQLVQFTALKPLEMQGRVFPDRKSTRLNSSH